MRIATDRYDIAVTDALVLPKTEGVGIKLDVDTPAFGWRDIIGDPVIRNTGSGAPTYKVIRGNIWGVALVANDVMDFTYHVPHDWVPGTDMHFHIHIHWQHNGTAITGTAQFTYYAVLAKRDVVYGSEVTGTISYATVNIATTPNGYHRVDEIQLSQAGGSAARIVLENIEVDALIKVRVKLTGLPTITGGDLFIDTADIHYQSSNLATKNKASPFYP